MGVHHRELEADVVVVAEAALVATAALEVLDSGDAEHAAPLPLELHLAQVAQVLGGGVDQRGDPLGGVLLPVGVGEGGRRHQAGEAHVERLDRLGALLGTHRHQSLEDVEESLGARWQPKEEVVDGGGGEQGIGPGVGVAPGPGDVVQLDHLLSKGQPELQPGFHQGVPGPPGGGDVVVTGLHRLGSRGPLCKRYRLPV